MNITPIYQRIWQKARPYYLEGRPMDIDHIEWFMAVASEIAEREGLDDSILLPLVILHDVGYSKVKDVATANYYNGDVRRLHMAEGAKIARQILEELEYDPEKTEKIVYYISVHDNWAFGEVDLFINDPLLGTFKDLDYIWMYTHKGFKGLQPTFKFDNQRMLEYLQSQPSPIDGKKPFSNESTRKLHDNLLAERENELKKL